MIPRLTPLPTFSDNIYHLSGNVFISSPVILEGRIPPLILSLFNLGTLYPQPTLFSFGRKILPSLFRENDVIQYFSPYLVSKPPDNMLFVALPSIQHIYRYEDLRNKSLTFIISSATISVL